MSYNLKQLLKNNSNEKLLASLEDKKFKKDETYWELTVDKANNGFATIRFLDAPYLDGEDGVPVVSYFSHLFKGPNGQWYGERSLTSIGEQDPVSEFNSKLWATSIESNKEIARAQKRNQNYVSNILVIADSAKPENNGKVFKYRYGRTIYELIQERIPENKKEDVVYDPDFKFFNPFHFLTGANLKLKAHDKDGFRSYTKSTFVDPSAISKNEEEIEKIWKSSYSLKEVVDRKHYKTYAELKTRLDVVLGLEGTPSASAEDSAAAEVDVAVAGSSNDDSDETFRKLAGM
jgi:DNA-binding CsgD family transcriptional regulator